MFSVGQSVCDFKGIIWLVLIVYSVKLPKFEVNEFWAAFQPWQSMNRIPFLAPGLILVAPVLQWQTIVAQMATAAKRALDRLQLNVVLEHHLNKGCAVLYFWAHRQKLWVCECWAIAIGKVEHLLLAYKAICVFRVRSSVLPVSLHVLALILQCCFWSCLLSVCFWS